MNKEEILKKARNHKKLDEYEDNIYKLATRYAFACMGCLCLILMIMKDNVHQSSYDVLSVASLGIAVSSLYTGFKLQDKHHLFQGITWTLLAIFSFYLYYQSLFG